MVGFWTDANKKLKMDDSLQELVTFGRFCFADNFISINDDPSLIGDKVIEKLVCQLEDMKEYTTMKGGVIRRIITSILREDMTIEDGKHDDLQRALSMLIYASALLLTGKLPMDYSKLAKLREERKIEISMTRPELDEDIKAKEIVHLSNKRPRSSKNDEENRPKIRKIDMDD
jgi:hypothetical protein